MYPKTGKMVDMQIALHEVRERRVNRAVGLASEKLEEVKEVFGEESPKEKANKSKKKKS